MFEDFEKKWAIIDAMSFKVMAQAPRFMPMLGGFVLENNEIAQFPKLLSMYLYDAGINLDESDEKIQPFVQMAVEQMQANRATNAKVFSIPKPLLERKYKGCGNGIVVIDKTTNAVLDFDYTNSKLKPINEQNINMTKAAGKKIREDAGTITYRANFSSCQVCLF